MTPPRIAETARALFKGAAELIALSLFCGALILGALALNF